jgi:hypothetical protein
MGNSGKDGTIRRVFQRVETRGGLDMKYPTSAEVVTSLVID